MWQKTTPENFDQKSHDLVSVWHWAPSVSGDHGKWQKDQAPYGQYRDYSETLLHLPKWQNEFWQWISLGAIFFLFWICKIERCAGTILHFWISWCFWSRGLWPKTFPIGMIRWRVGTAFVTFFVFFSETESGIWDNLHLQTFDWKGTFTLSKKIQVCFPYFSCSVTYVSKGTESEALNSRQPESRAALLVLRSDFLQYISQSRACENEPKLQVLMKVPSLCNLGLKHSFILSNSVISSQD